MSKAVAVLVTAIPMTWLAAACGDPPTLPPSDSMLLPAFEHDHGNALASADTTQNVSQAVVSVGLVTVAIRVALLAPQALWAGVASQKPNHEDDTWVWANTFPLLGIEGELRANLDSGTLHTEMRVQGLRNQPGLDNFLYFEGDHRAGDGQWQLYATDHAEGPVLAIDWQRQSSTDKSLVFSNVKSGVPGTGDYVAYALDGTAASFAIHDALTETGDPADFSVHWDTETGAGKIIRVSGEQACWDTLENGQQDISCP